MDDPVKQTIATYDNLAADYVTHYVDRTPYQDLYDYFIAHLQGKRVLDVGCGAGHDVAFFTSHDLEVTGMDLSTKLLAFAKKSVPKASFTKMDMRTLEFPPKMFDGLWVMTSFQHLPKTNALKTLRGFKRVLKDSGILYISVTEGEGEGMVGKDRYQGMQKHFSNYVELEIRDLLANAGFRVLEVQRAKTKRQNSFMDIFAVPT
ncbi:MAG: class I SAM-dependent methyltransferase, partial [Candidatus Berkelbacteria bacterium]|nr:class I SAM-dependent methyltransferase [Candidatus Berkelbacteria bacterium]